MVTLAMTEAAVVSRCCSTVSSPRLMSPMRLRLGRSWARVAVTVSRAESSVKTAATTLGFLIAASDSASSRVAGRIGRSLVGVSTGGAWPTARTYSARLVCTAPPGCLARRGGGGKPRLGLRHVGPGRRADAEFVIGRLELAAQHLLVVDVELH